MAIAGDHRSGRQFLSIVGSVLPDREPAIRSDASIDALSFCPVLGCDLTWASPEFFVLRIDLYVEPLFPTGSSLHAAKNWTRLFTSDRPADSNEHLCWTIGGEARDAFPDRGRIYHRLNRFFLARLGDG